MKKTLKRTWDFEGRCEKCAEPLKLYITVISRDIIMLQVESCPQHPNSSHILWPKSRTDIISKYFKK